MACCSPLIIFGSGDVHGVSFTYPLISSATVLPEEQEWGQSYFLCTLPNPTPCPNHQLLVDFNKDNDGPSLVVQWLRLHLPMQVVQVRSLVGERIRSYMPRGQKNNT